MTRKYGWIEQPRDDKDLRYSAAKPLFGLPAKSDLSSQLPACWDQGATSSCTYHGISGAIWSAMVIAGLVPFMPSRLFGYYNERLLEGTTGLDDGAIIRDGMKASNIYGIVSETFWQFDQSKVLTKPPPMAYAEALKLRTHLYASVEMSNLDQIRLALSHKIPVVFGFDVFESFEGSEIAKTGIMPIPTRNERILGGHCVLAIGHDDPSGMALCRNSWGSTGWGLKGNFLMPYEYLTSRHCSDGWVLRLK